MLTVCNKFTNTVFVGNMDIGTLEDVVYAGTRSYRAVLYNGYVTHWHDHVTNGVSIEVDRYLATVAAKQIKKDAQ